MIHKIKFGNSTITYSVTKSKRRKTSQIIVDEDGIKVKTPITKKDSEIREMISSKIEWIFKKQLEFADRQNMASATIKPKTSKYLEERVGKMALKMNLRPSRIIIKNLKSRWGSCTKDGVITINIALSKAPSEVIDYVVVHELCHLKFRDHSWRFWRLVSSHCENYERQVQWLESNSKSIFYS